MRKLLVCLLIITVSICLSGCSNKAKDDIPVESEYVEREVTVSYLEPETNSNEESSNFESETISSETPSFVYSDELITPEFFETDMRKMIKMWEYTSTPNPDGVEHVYDHVGETELEKAKTDFEIVIEGEKITLPISVGDMIKKGFRITSIDFVPMPEVMTDADLSVKFYSSNVDWITKKGNVFSSCIVSSTGQYAPLKDCLIDTIDLELYDFLTGEKKNTTLDFKMIGKINEHSTFEDILTDLKEPSEITHRYYGMPNGAEVYLTYDISNGSMNGHVYVYVESKLAANRPEVNRVRMITCRVDLS